MTDSSYSEPPHATAPQRVGGRELSVRMLAVLMNAPAVLLLVVVLVVPLCYALYLSFSKVSIGELRRGFPFPFFGVENYHRLFQDDLFWLALSNTFIFAFLVVVAEIILGLGVALLINNRKLWLSKATRFLVLLPYGVPPIANGLVWIYIYNFKLGFLNRVLGALGLIDGYVDWTGNPNTALYALTVPYIWRTLPFAVLLIHAALQGISQDYYEAAQVDGAGYWRSFFHITLPMLRPILTVVVILRTSFAFLVFDEVLALTQGGPGDATWVATWYSYKRSFAPPFNIGMGSASAWVLALLIGVMAVLYVKFLYRRTD
jgi:ABC-type sugar transport system permease subunit